MRATRTAPRGVAALGRALRANAGLGGPWTADTRRWRARLAVPACCLLLMSLAGACADDSARATGAIVARAGWPVAGQAAATPADEPSLPRVAPAGVVTIRATVSGADMEDVVAEFAATPGEAGSGTVENVPVGDNRTLTIDGLEVDGFRVYRGVVTGITVLGGQTSDVGTVAMNSAVWIAVWNSNEAVAGSGTDDDILFSRSSDVGVTWTPAALLNSDGVGDVGNDFRPRLGTDGAGTWVVVWSAVDFLLSGADIDLVFARSSDNGRTWSAPALLNSNATSDTGSDINHELATDGAGNWVIVWQSDQDLAGAGSDNDIFVSRSADNGASWSTVGLLNSTATNISGGDDVLPMVTTDSAGNWITAWNSSHDLDTMVGTDDDVMVSTSSDDGANWSTVQALNSGAATDDPASDAAVHLTTDGGGTWQAVWRSTADVASANTDADIFASRSTNNGADWSADTVLNSNAAGDMGGDDNPVALASASGAWVVVWQSNENLAGAGSGDLDLMVARLVSGNWTAVELLNSTAVGDNGDDQAPALATDGLGNWIAAWESTENEAGAETDADIMLSRSSNDGLNWRPVGLLNSTATGDTGDDRNVAIAR